MKKRRPFPGKRRSTSARLTKASGLEKQILDRGAAQDAGPQREIDQANDDDIDTILQSGGPEIDPDNLANDEL